MTKFQQNFLIVVALVCVIGVAFYIQKQEDSEALAIRSRCLTVAEETRSVFKETSIYSSPFYYTEPTKTHYEKNYNLLISLHAFIGCIENDHAFSKNHTVNKYRENALMASGIIRDHNESLFLSLCSEPTVDDQVSISKKMWMALGKSEEEAEELIRQSQLEQVNEMADHEKWCDEYSANK